MNIKTKCPFCLRKLVVRPTLAGRTVNCPGCKNRITIRVPKVRLDEGSAKDDSAEYVDAPTEEWVVAEGLHDEPRRPPSADGFGQFDVPDPIELGQVTPSDQIENHCKSDDNDRRDEFDAFNQIDSSSEIDGYESSDEFSNFERSYELNQSADSESLNDSVEVNAPRLMRRNTRGYRDNDDDLPSDEVQRPAWQRNRWLLMSLIGIGGGVIGFPIGYLLKGVVDQRNRPPAINQSSQTPASTETPSSTE